MTFAGKDRPPLLRHFSYTWLVPVWFLGLLGAIGLTLPALITLNDLLRLIALLVAIVATVLMLLDRRWHFGPWAASIVGLFGLLPVCFSLVLLINRLIGNEREEVHRILFIERSSQRSGLLLHLENDAYAPFPERMRAIDHQPDIWRQGHVVYRIHQGVLGIPVLLERSFIPSANGEMIPHRLVE